MKLARLIWISVAAIAALLLISLAVLLNASFQTWAVHRALAANPSFHTTIGTVSASFGHVDLSDVRIERQGVRVLAPAVSADIAVLPALLGRRVSISRLVASGWTVTEAPPPSSSGDQPAVAGGAGAVATTTSPTVAPGTVAPGAVGRVFSGLFPNVQLPVDLSVDSLELTGHVVLVSLGNAATVRLTGGDLGAGHEGKLEVAADVTLADQTVKSLKLRGTLTVTMETPRLFSRAGAAFEMAASGGQLSSPVTLHVDFSAARTPQGEKYSVAVAGPDRPLLVMQGDYGASQHQITGGWKIDLRDADVAPFLIGKPLPRFAAVGQGTLDWQTTLAAVHAIGRLQASVDHLSALKPELAGIGPVKLTADVDVAQRGDVISVNNIDVALAVDPSAREPSPGAAGASRPARQVGTVRSLQLFEFNPASGELRASDSAKDLIGIVFQGVPVSWMKPFFTNCVVDGGEIRGEVEATPRAGGLTFRSSSPLVVTDLSVTRLGRKLVHNVDLALSVTGDYTPQGWQAELSSGSVKSSAGTIAEFRAKAGRLSQGDQPIKATGSLRVALGLLATQPVVKDALNLTQGDAAVDFAASIDSKKELQASVSLANLGVGSGAALQRLPSVTGTVRADVSPDGRVVVNAPIAIEQEGRKSDFTVAGVFSHPAEALVVDAQLTSAKLIVDDARLLASAIARGGAQSGNPVASGARPLWADLEGVIALQLKNLVYSDSLELNNVAGSLRFSGGSVKFENIRAAVGEGGNAQVNGALAYDPKARQPYALGAYIALTDFNPGPLFAAVSPGLPPTVDGRFSLTTRVAAKGNFLRDLPNTATGDFEFTSRGGVFRGLSVSVGNLVENSSKLGTWLSAAGNAITSLWARKDYDEITSRSQAASELAKILSVIAYDQLSIVFTRDEDLNTRVKDFTLISPEIRITGSGFARSVPEHSILNDIVTLELHLRARGRPAELLKYLGVLEQKPDELGYAACTIPIRVEGTLARLDTMQLSNRLVALAVEKTGLTEKAIDWINRLRGKTETR